MKDFIKILLISVLTVLWLSVATAKIASKNAKLSDPPVQAFIAPAQPAGADFLRPKETIVGFLQRHGASKPLAQSLWKLPKSKQRLLTGIQTSQPIVCYKSNKKFKSCHIIAGQSLVSVVKLGNQLSVEKKPLDVTKSIDYGVIDIKTSIFNDGRK